MKFLEQSFTVKFSYKVVFTSGLFHPTNNDFNDFLINHRESGSHQKILFLVDEGMVREHPQLIGQIREYFKNHNSVSLVENILVLPGGEVVKNNKNHLNSIIQAVDSNGIDRQSYVAAIGGGSILDLAGYAAAIAHRGIRHIRIPTTVLSQNDSGIGVKNGVNYKGKKNFLGTFVPPFAVFNDDTFLSTLDERNWRSGISEAIKVALIKDADFFYWIEEKAEKLVARDRQTMNELINRCATLHLQHIASGDPFEFGSSRPLDFGHWSAHKLEQLTDFQVLHGEAVAMGIALDTIYSAESGRLNMDKAIRVIQLLLKLGFDITHPLMQFENGNNEVLQGLQEFREHLGGRLTIMLLKDIGLGEEVHEMDTSLLLKASDFLRSHDYEISA